MDTGFGLKAWPIYDDGALPIPLFDKHLLGDAIFKEGVKKWRCPPRSIRHALKALAKRHGVSIRSHSNKVEVRERDCELVWAVCSAPEARANFSDLEILDDGSSRRKQGATPPVRGFAEAFWDLLIKRSDDEDTARLAEWSLENAPKRSDPSDRHFFDAASLRKAVEKDDCPVPTASLVFARNVALFAALLPTNQRSALIETAIELGAIHLTILAGPSTSTDVSSSDPAPQTAPPAIVLQAPTLLIPPACDSQDPLPLGELPEVALLQGRQARDRGIEAEAKQLFGPTFDRRAVQSAQDLAKSITVLNDLHQSRIDLVEAEQHIEAAVARAARDVARMLQRPFTSPAPTIGNAIQLNGVLEAAKEFESQMSGVSEWLETLPNPLTLSTLSSLPNRVAAYRARERAQEVYVSKTIEFLRQPIPKEQAIHWLLTLQSVEIISLLKSEAFEKWVVPSAIFLRLGLERGDQVFIREVTNWLITLDDVGRRRDLLRFLDPSSSIYDLDLRLRRIIVVERLREIISIGPLAAITDQSTGLADPSIVGRSVSAVVNLLSANLAEIQSASDIASLLSPSSARIFTADKLIRFIQTPSSMAGHFKRLREIARETLLLPLLVGSGVDVSASRRVVQMIDDGEAQSRVIRAFYDADVSRARLDTKHETQLARYLKNAKDLLVQTQQADENKPFARKDLLAAEIKTYTSTMALRGAIGSQDWVESEFRQIFEDPYVLLPDATLLGRQANAHEIGWSDSDTLWARTELDLACFYQPGQTLLDIAACSLETVARDRAPSSMELADELVRLGHYKTALELLKDRTGDDAALRTLRQRVDTLLAPRVARIDASLGPLSVEYGPLLQSSGYFRSVTQALKNRDIDIAEEHLELLRIELADMQLNEAKTLASAKEKSSSEVFQKRLLAAGVALKENASLADLERAWKQEFDQRASHRSHLSATIAIFEDFDARLQVFATFIPALNAFKAKQDDPTNWLQSERSAALTDFLQPSTARLTSWAGSANFSPSRMQRALAIVFEVHLQFVSAQIDNIASLEPASNIDNILERVFEYAEAVKSAPDPAACVHALREIGELKGDRDLDSLIETASPPSTIDEVNLQLREALATSAWQSAAKFALSARSIAPDDSAKRLDEVIDFARTMAAIDNDRSDSIAPDMLEVAARALGTAGHPVHRSLSARSHVTFALRLISTALTLDSPNHPMPSDNKRPLASLLEVFPDLFKAINETGRFPTASKILEQLLAGPLGSDLSERIWSVATGHNEQGAYRAEFLRFLNEHGCQDAIVRLAGRFDPAIRTKLEQLLDLRAAAIHRPELYPAADALAEQASLAAKSAPFRAYVKRLPSIGQVSENSIDVEIEEDLVLRESLIGSPPTIHVTLVVTPRGMVSEQLQAQLTPEDDVVFSGKRTRVMVLSDELMYVPTQFTIDVELGETWRSRISRSEPARFRLRLSAKTITQKIVTVDVDCSFRRVDRGHVAGPRLDNESILEFYPGVGNTPAEGANFVGRFAEIKKLETLLVSARQPTPILLTGMRRIGKTSLLYAFHQRYCVPNPGNALSIYLSIAEQRSAFLSSDRSVAGTLMKAITRAIAKPYFPASDHNRIVGERLKAAIGEDRNAVRVALEKTYDAESFADSLMILSETISDLTGTQQRVIFLIDEAETLTVPYSQGGSKKIELEQLMQSLREVSQTTSKVGVVLSGSNHIVEFSREYKNAFFGSCARIELSGITERLEAQRIIAPSQVSPFVQFDVDAVDYGAALCAGMPQFMWQVGASTAARVRSGPAHRSDVRSAVNALVNERGDDLPFKPYDVLEPLEHMLSLRGERERDLLWLLLRRVALHSSLANVHVARHFIVDQTLLELDSKDQWSRRLGLLVELDVLTVPQPQNYAFKVPLFAEAFRATRNNHEQTVRLQRVSI